ncbi:hypothetical protein KH5_06090 [Urechidicola sp. KH5]
MKRIVVLFIVVIVYSCSNEKPTAEESFEMYQTSELAQMMEEMYVFHDSLKTRIVLGDSLLQMPYNLQLIHSASMSENFNRDENFTTFAKVFENYQEQLYSVPKDSVKEVYNLAINTCVACHQTSCTGPIPRIEKLKIP